MRRFRVKCIESNYPEAYTVNDIYNITDGFIFTNDGYKLSFRSVGSWNNEQWDNSVIPVSKFEIVEE